MLSSSISNLGYTHYLNERLDRCSDVSDLKKLILLSKAKKRCYNSEELERYNDIVNFETQKHSTKKQESCVTVIQDNIVEWTRRNPGCSTLPQWELICNQIRLKYKLELSIEEIASNSVNLLLDIESSEKVKENIYNLILDIKSVPSSNTSSLELETKEISSEKMKLSYDLIKKSIPSFSLTLEEYKAYSSKYNINPKTVDLVYSSGAALKSVDNELHLQINRNSYPLRNINPAGLQLQVR